MTNNKFIYLIFYFFLISNNLYSKENLYFYEEALKTEKVSPIFSLQLYETFLKQNPPKKYSTAVIFRLFDLYYNLNKTEELLILSETYSLDKSRIIRLEIFIQKLSKDKLKDQILKSENIKLIKIGYWQINKVDYILKKELINEN